MLSEDFIEQLKDRLTAAELVDFLGITIDQVIDAFEPQIDARVDQIEDIYGIEAD